MYFYDFHLKFDLAGSKIPALLYGLTWFGTTLTSNGDPYYSANTIASPRPLKKFNITKILTLNFINSSSFMVTRHS